MLTVEMADPTLIEYWPSEDAGTIETEIGGVVQRMTVTREWLVENTDLL